VCYPCFTCVPSLTTCVCMYMYVCVPSLTTCVCMCMYIITRRQSSWGEALTFPSCSIRPMCVCVCVCVCVCTYKCTRFLLRCACKQQEFPLLPASTNAHRKQRGFGSMLHHSADQGASGSQNAHRKQRGFGSMLPHSADQGVRFQACKVRVACVFVSCVCVGSCVHLRVKVFLCLRVCVCVCVCVSMQTAQLMHYAYGFYGECSNNLSYILYTYGTLLFKVPSPLFPASTLLIGSRAGPSFLLTVCSALTLTHTLTHANTHTLTHTNTHARTHMPCPH